MTCTDCERLRERLEAALAENAELAAHLEVLMALHDNARNAQVALSKQLLNARTMIRRGP